MSAGFLAGLVVGLVIGYAIGKAYARALRAYRDLMATKKAIKGLFRRVVSEWATVIKVSAGFGLLFALLFTAGVMAAIR